jgi:uncharacterized protein YjiS (DUF1127 family)
MSIQYLTSDGCEMSGEELTQRAGLSRLKDFLRRRIDALRKDRALRKQWRINRLAFQHMLYLNDRILEDIGVTRADVFRANGLPLRVNAALELRKISRMNYNAAHRPSSKKF